MDHCTKGEIPRTKEEIHLRSVELHCRLLRHAQSCPGSELCPLGSQNCCKMKAHLNHYGVHGCGDPACALCPRIEKLMRVADKRDEEQKVGGVLAILIERLEVGRCGI